MARLKHNRLAMLGIVFLILMALASIFAPVITTGDFAAQDLLKNNAVPSWILFLLPENAENYARIDNTTAFGYDNLGRDLWTRAVYGARISLLVAVVASTVSLIIGTVYGLASGYLGGKADDLMMRIVDFFYGFPFLIAVVLLQTYFKALSRRGGDAAGLGGFVIGINNAMGGMFFLFIAIGLLNWLGMARIARAQVLSIREKEYVEAARSIGSNGFRIIFKHILPNIIGPLIVFESLAIPGYIFLEAFLSFIGLGVDAPTPSWGIMISESAQAIRSYPNQLLLPAVALTLTTLAFNFVGDGFRDAFDPRLKE
jgi:oligopeptide transport system permease protein